MKRILIFKMVLMIFLLSVNNFIKAQDEEIQTLFNGQPLHVGGFGGPFMNFSTLDNEFAFLMGGGGGVYINNFFIGGYGVGLANNIEFGNTGDELSYGHGGFWLGYNFHPNKLVHFSIQTQLGWGKIDRRNSYHELVDNIDKIFVITPVAEAEMNITRYFRIAVGGHYRISTMVDNEIFDSGDLSGPGISLSFKFGWL